MFISRNNNYWIYVGRTDLRIVNNFSTLCRFFHEFDGFSLTQSMHSYYWQICRRMCTTDLKIRVNLTAFNFRLLEKFQRKRIFILVHFVTRVWNAAKNTQQTSHLFLLRSYALRIGKRVGYSSEWSVQTVYIVTKCHFESCVTHLPLCFSRSQHSGLGVWYFPHADSFTIWNVHRGRTCASRTTIWFWS